MILFQKPIESLIRRKDGFGLMEVLIGVALAVIFGGLTVALIRKQAQERRLSETKVALQLLHNRAQQAVKRFMAFEMENFINANAAQRNCFDAKGGNCVFPSSVPSFPGAVAGNRQFEMNRMMNGTYHYSGRPCDLAICPVQVTTMMDFVCEGMSCTEAKFRTTVTINNSSSNAEEKRLFASIAPLSSEAIYNKTKRIGLVRSLSAKCDVPTEANLVTQVMDCDTAVLPNNPNEIFDSNIGLNFMNGDLTLVGGTATGTTGGPPVISCPPCMTAVMTSNGLECKPSVLCTNPGWVVRGCKCCQPSIPNGGDGWGSWGVCSTPCAPGGGTQTRTCQYPKEEYCDSTCSKGQTETRGCTLPNATNSWSGWSTCSKTCGGGTQTRTCAQPRGQFCNSNCNLGEVESRSCRTQPCSKVTETLKAILKFSLKGGSVSLACPKGTKVISAEHKGTKEPCRISKTQSKTQATLTCKAKPGTCLETKPVVWNGKFKSGICDVTLTVVCE